MGGCFRKRQQTCCPARRWAGDDVENEGLEAEIPEAIADLPEKSRPADSKYSPRAGRYHGMRGSRHNIL